MQIGGRLDAVYSSTLAKVAAAVLPQARTTVAERVVGPVSEPSCIRKQPPATPTGHFERMTRVTAREGHRKCRRPDEKRVWKAIVSGKLPRFSGAEARRSEARAGD